MFIENMIGISINPVSMLLSINPASFSIHSLGVPVPNCEDRNNLHFLNYSYNVLPPGKVGQEQLFLGLTGVLFYFISYVAWLKKDNNPYGISCLCSSDIC
jgi:hypothetical protein